MKVVIIGGVAGGASAAARLRRLDEQAEIIILERSGFVSYANCGLPYYVGGVIPEKSALSLQTPESFWQRFRIEVRVKNEVISLDTALKTVTVKRLEDGSEYTESYDKLILSPGAKAIRPPLPGIENSRIMTLRTVEDTETLRNFLVQQKPKHAVVVGGGFIGLETAENLLLAGVQTTLVELGDQVLAPLDYDMACAVHNTLRSHALDLRLRTAVSGFEETAHGIRVLLKDGAALEADLVLLAIGVVPDTQLAVDAKLTLGLKNAIVVSEKMETSATDVYAVGDAVQVQHFVTGTPALVSLAGPANKQGRIAANAMCGIDGDYTGAQGSSILKLFNTTVATTGINEKTAQTAGLAYGKVITTSASHATYYPGASTMTIKTLFAPDTGKILGAQVIGFEGVDKRIDVLATVIRFGGTAADLEQLDLAYAPPYSSAKDPVNMAGFVIENIRSGLVQQFHWPELAALQQDGSALLLDVRTAGEYQSGHIPGTRNIPLDELREHLAALDKRKRIYVNCHSGLRSYLACRILSQHGFTCYNLAGGYHFYATLAADCVPSAQATHPCGLRIEL